MNSNRRDQITAVWNRETPDFIPIEPCGFWAETLARWYGEGLSPDSDANMAAGITDSYMDFIPVNLGMLPEFEFEIISTDIEYITVKDEYGVTKKMLLKDYYATGGRMSSAGAAGSMSHWLDYPVKNLSDWEQIFSRRFSAGAKECLPEDWPGRKAALLESAKKRIIGISSFPFLGTFGAVRQLMGLEGMIYAMNDDTDLVSRIVEDLCGHWIKVLQYVLKQIPVDMVIMFEDMCYNHSSLISPSGFAAFFSSAYIKLREFLNSNGIRQLYVDTDGNAKGMIPVLIDSGVTGMLPVEVQAGMDAEILTEAYPQLTFKGGIDKRCLTYGKSEIEYELRRRFDTAWRKGGYIPAIDHGIPPNVPFDNFKWYVELYRKYSKDITG